MKRAMKQKELGFFRKISSMTLNNASSLPKPANTLLPPPLLTYVFTVIRPRCWSLSWGRAGGTLGGRVIRQLVVPHGVFLKTTLKQSQEPKHRPSASPEPAAGRASSPGPVGASPWLVVLPSCWVPRPSEPLPPGAAHLPEPQL